MTSKDELLTIGPAAKRAGVSPGWLRLLADMGKVPHTRAGQIRLFKVGDMDRLKAERARKPKGRAG
jgi:DNA-binding transcriptional MerR regulator